LNKLLINTEGQYILNNKEKRAVGEAIFLAPAKDDKTKLGCGRGGSQRRNRRGYEKAKKRHKKAQEMRRLSCAR
jgi:hypothetical protein